LVKLVCYQSSQLNRPDLYKVS